MMDTCKAFIKPHTASYKIAQYSDLVFYSCAAAASYALALWFAKETVRDMGYTYALYIKPTYLKTYEELGNYRYKNKPVLNEIERQAGAILQALYRVPHAYWREIIAVIITIALIKTGNYNYAKL